LLLDEQLILADAPATGLVVCGGSALIATGLIVRTTRDVDILAFMDDDGMREAEELPGYLLHAAQNVGRLLGLPPARLNNGPASQFRLGLPDGCQGRLLTVTVGEKLTMHYIGRLDQIFFKTFASVDRGGYHVQDLLALHPTVDELLAAGKWCLTQDVSAEFRMVLKDMFGKLGWKNVGDQL